MSLQITNEDNMLMMARYPDNHFDLILTDPPFGMEFKSGRRKLKHEKIKDDDNLFWLPEFLKETHRIAKPDAHHYYFCSNHFVDIFVSEIKKAGLPYKNLLVWEKNNFGMGDLLGDYAPQYEFIVFCSNGQKKLNGRRDSNIIKSKKTNNELHPTQKPEYLMRYLLSKSSEVNDIVVDPFMGSGTTAVACSIENRQFVGCDIEKKYFDVADRRIKQLESQHTLFGIAS